MDLAMVTATERDGELVADLASECPRLRKAQVMRIRRLAAAEEGGIDKSALALPEPRRVRDREHVRYCRDIRLRLWALPPQRPLSLPWRLRLFG
jgi:hypothetical protein